ncbi:MAG TPA: ABC transporter ATP-binding protein [Firmicutes bacterium]|nr:ABC transporter ATP-binding protein [Bacillota bacterium]
MVNFLPVMIEVNDLTKIYFSGKKRIVGLNKVNFNVRKGEIFGILGPNGSGKTTCLKLISGIIFPTSGKISIMGRNPFEIGVKRYIGFLPENPYYYDYLTGPELLSFYAKLFNLPSYIIKKRIDGLLELVGLSDVRDIPLKHYSRGMLERIGLASALINNPRILILDEPTAGLDPIGCREIRDILLKLKSEGKTILLSSHFLSEVEKICDRIAIFHRGNLLTAGRLENLLHRYDAENLETLFVNAIEEFENSKLNGEKSMDYSN